MLISFFRQILILIIFIVIGTGIALAAFLEFSSSHTYPWIGMKFTFWIYHLIQQESTECFLNCPDSFRFDEILFHIPNFEVSCVTLLVSLKKKVHVLPYVVSAKVGSLVLSQTRLVMVEFEFSRC